MASLDEVLKTDIAHISDLRRAASGDLDKISGLSNVKNALFHRLMTVPGSLVHRPNYGVGIKNYQNAPNSISIYQELALRIKEQFEEDPRVTAVTGVRVESEDLDPSRITVTVRVTIAGYDEEELKFTPFSEGV